MYDDFVVGWIQDLLEQKLLEQFRSNLHNTFIFNQIVSTSNYFEIFIKQPLFWSKI